MSVFRKYRKLPFGLSYLHLSASNLLWQTFTKCYHAILILV